MVPRLGPRRAMNPGTQGRDRPAIICRPISSTSGPLTAPPMPGTGMNAGRMAMNRNTPNALSWRPCRILPSGCCSSGSPCSNIDSRVRMPSLR